MKLIWWSQYLLSGWESVLFTFLLLLISQSWSTLCSQCSLISIIDIIPHILSTIVHNNMQHWLSHHLNIIFRSQPFSTSSCSLVHLLNHEDNILLWMIHVKVRKCKMYIFSLHLSSYKITGNDSDRFVWNV